MLDLAYRLPYNANAPPRLIRQTDAYRGCEFEFRRISFVRQLIPRYEWIDNR